MLRMLLPYETVLWVLKNEEKDSRERFVVSALVSSSHSMATKGAPTPIKVALEAKHGFCQVSTTFKEIKKNKVQRTMCLQCGQV